MFGMHCRGSVLMSWPAPRPRHRTAVKEHWGTSREVLTTKMGKAEDVILFGNLDGCFLRLRLGRGHRHTRRCCHMDLDRFRGRFGLLLNSDLFNGQLEVERIATLDFGGHGGV